MYNTQVSLPKVLDQRLLGDQVKLAPTALTKLGAGLANIMFVNPLPHALGNISQQQAFAGGGVSALAQGAKDAIALARKDPAAHADVDAARNVGATPATGYASEEPAKTLVGRAIDKINGGLSTYHDAQTTRYYKNLTDKGMAPEEAAEEVRKAFGRNGERSPVARDLGQVGARFADWTLGTVPRAGLKAVTSPQGRGALRHYSRAVDDVNKDVFEPDYGVEFNPGGFASRVASLAFRPASYAAGQSLDNQLHAQGDEATSHPLDILKSVIPFGGLIDLAKQPLNDNQRARGVYDDLPLFARLATLVGGYFTHAETPEQTRLRELQREGVR